MKTDKNNSNKQYTNQVANEISKVIRKTENEKKSAPELPLTAQEGLSYEACL